MQHPDFFNVVIDLDKGMLVESDQRRLFNIARRAKLLSQSYWSVAASQEAALHPLAQY
jgi:hypothetical protein